MTMRVPKRTRREACRCEVVHRGPNWVVVRVEAPGADATLGDRLWRIARQHFVNRLVVEFAVLRGGGRWLVEPMGKLCSRLAAHGGALRLCGLTEGTAATLLERVACPRLHNHATWQEAVMGAPCCDGEAEGHRPTQPR